MEAVKFYYKNTELKPYKAYETDAGWDLRSAINTVIEPLTYQFIPTGIKTAIPKGYFGKIEARSSLALKRKHKMLCEKILENYERKKGEKWEKAKEEKDTGAKISS